MRYEVEIMPSALRGLRKLDPPTQSRILAAIDRLAENPRPPGCRKLAGAHDLYRIRVGRYRVAYRIRDVVLVVLVLEIGSRRDIYRRIRRY